MQCLWDGRCKPPCLYAGVGFEMERRALSNEKARAAVCRAYDADKKRMGLSFAEMTVAVLHPESCVRIIWDYVTAFSLVAVAIVLPLFIGFDLTSDPFSACSVVMVVIDGVFLLDVWMSFR